MTDTPTLADPDTLLGLLQRGRGKGYLLALKTPPEEVWPLLFECITNDPRIDSQCEWRQEYYADLVLAARMDLESLRHYLKKTDADDGDVTLLLTTLLCMAGERRSPQALDIVREYLSYGSHWEPILHHLGEMGTADTVAGVVEVLCRRIANDSDLRSEFGQSIRETWQSYCSSYQGDRDQGRWLLPFCEPWRTICRTNPQLAALFSELGIDFNQPGPPRERLRDEQFAGLSLEDLFSQVNKSNRVVFHRVLVTKVSAIDEDYLLRQLSSNDAPRMKLAFAGLGAIGTSRAFEVVKSYIEASENADATVRAAAFGAFAWMPGSLTLGIARQWFRREEWYLQVAAGHVIENHATVEDIPLLTEVLRTPGIANREDSRLSSAMEAFKLFKGIGRVPELEAVFHLAGDCYDRYRAAEAMYATAPAHFVDQYAFECLWDCHWDTRAFGCETVSLSTPGVLSRLRELAADPYEISQVREPAQARLGK